MSKVFDDLKAQHIRLLDEYATAKDSEDFLKKVQVFIEEIGISSRDVSDSSERGNLRAILRYWGSFVYDKTGSYPKVDLAPALEQKQTIPLSPASRYFLPVVIIVALLGSYMLYSSGLLPTIRATATPSETFMVTMAPTVEALAGLQMQVRVECKTDASGKTSANVIVKALNGTPPYILPGFDFVDTQTIPANVGDTLQITVWSSDKPHLSWTGDVLVTCVTPTPSVTPEPLPDPITITDSTGVWMILIPSGNFQMGSSEGELDEQAVHTVFLDSYYMDMYEVTNTSYKECVDAKVCLLPKKKSSASQKMYYGISEFAFSPVIHVDWNMANAYCEWRGARLPTEAEWEKAARGTTGRDFPWGNNPRMIPY